SHIRPMALDRLQVEQREIHLISRGQQNGAGFDRQEDVFCKAARHVVLLWSIMAYRVNALPIAISRTAPATSSLARTLMPPIRTPMASGAKVMPSAISGASTTWESRKNRPKTHGAVTASRFMFAINAKNGPTNTNASRTNQKYPRRRR